MNNPSKIILGLTLLGLGCLSLFTTKTEFYYQPASVITPENEGDHITQEGNMVDERKHPSEPLECHMSKKTSDSLLSLRGSRISENLDDSLWYGVLLSDSTRVVFGYISKNGIRKNIVKTNSGVFELLKDAEPLFSVEAGKCARESGLTKKE